jgi:hypothetical protein
VERDVFHLEAISPSLLGTLMRLFQNKDVRHCSFGNILLYEEPLNRALCTGTAEAGHS